MKKSLVAILILIVVAVGAMGLWRYKQNQKKVPPSPKGQLTDTDKKVEPLQVEISRLPNEQIPAGFPSDFPFEAKVEVLNNYVGQAESGEQSTRQFYSQKSPGDNFKLYDKYFKDKKWQILLSFGGSEPYSISAKDPSGNVYDLSITTDQSSKKTIVSASVTKAKK